VAAELIPREQAGEFRLLSGTEPDCVQAYHPTVCGLLSQTARGSPPRHMMGHVFMTHDVTGLAGFRGKQPVNRIPSGRRSGRRNRRNDRRPVRKTVDGMLWRLFRHPKL